MTAPPKGSCESVSNVPEACVGKQRVNQMIEWLAQAATTVKCFLLTGRLYWLLGALPNEDRSLDEKQFLACYDY